jgi:hypothetical protein
MARKKYDFRTDREKLRDEQCEVIARRFRELMPFTDYPNRVFTKIAEELNLKRTCVRSRCIRMGIYVPGTSRGRNGGHKVNL